jgi:Cof subfamily protein (haloacid dehalogenase superfamily)
LTPPLGPGGSSFDGRVPHDVGLIACDLDGTLLGPDLVIRERTRAAIAAARAAGIHVAICTGRMFQSALPYARAAGLDGPIVCYQGAAVVDVATAEFLLHEPIPVDLALDAIDAIEAIGHTLNVYVDDELYVSELTPEAERYAAFQHLTIYPVGDLRAWLRRPPTKLVSVGEPDAMDALKLHMLERFDDRLHISKSLAIFLELSRKGVTKGSGLAFLANLLGVPLEHVVAFGDAENDLELLRNAGFGISVSNGDPVLLGIADAICPPADEEGPAQVIEAIVAGRRTLAP